ncbi:MAG: addiction module antidote protein [Sphingomonadaceae bacterium]|nr:addiction module antidote protein [Sphingomonadaceae bacterium]
MQTNRFLTALQRLPDMSVRDTRHILSARIWCISRRAVHDPLPRLESVLQSGMVAKRFGLLMEVVMAVWPDPFVLFPPCCAAVSVDEGLLARAVELAVGNARPQFDELLREMLPEDARNTLFIRARQLYLVRY